MSRDVAVVHPSRGLQQALVRQLRSHGYRGEDDPDDLSGWLAARPGAVLVLPADDDRWLPIRRGHPDATLIAIISEHRADAYQHAYANGASGVVSTNDLLDEAVPIIDDALRGWSRVPVEVVQLMAATASTGPPHDVTLADQEIDALRRLSEGATVVDLARDLSVSEREMHRMLSGLYHRMGVHSRAEAIVLGTRWGLIPAP
jgi:DNA-binding NarL/FixJ family response regulator